MQIKLSLEKYIKKYSLLEIDGTDGYKKIKNLQTLKPLLFCLMGMFLVTSRHLSFELLRILQQLSKHRQALHAEC